jgi:hypothetical protein
MATRLQYDYPAHLRIMQMPVGLTPTRAHSNITHNYI